MIISINMLELWVRNLKGKKLVVTNGCFDIIHAGHVEYLEAAKALGDVLLIGLNSDSSVQRLKGPNRPFNRQEDRAVVLLGLKSVDAVCIFDESTATRFLTVARPAIWVKGGDYTLASINREELEAAGGAITILPMSPGKSTTSLVNRILQVGH